MNKGNKQIYQMAIAGMQGLSKERRNMVLARLGENSAYPDDFFALSGEELRTNFSLDDDAILAVQGMRERLSNFSRDASDLKRAGIELIDYGMENYPALLKKQLGERYCPPLLYCLGNLRILKEPVVAVVGARDAGEAALAFTAKIGERMSQEGKVVVSGFARGVDRKSLDATKEAGGHGIIVLPQGLFTFMSRLKNYRPMLEQGDLLVVSTFSPRDPWATGRAMERNRYIYGMAEEIYVAESNSKGGTWSGARDGLKRGLRVMVRQPLPGEQNANHKLIEAGAIPLDQDGFPLSSQTSPEIQNPADESSDSTPDLFQGDY